MESGDNKIVKAKGIRWDLSDLYKSLDDPQIDADLTQAQERIKAFTEKYKGKMDALSAQELHDAVAEMEKIIGLVIRGYYYADLMFSENTVDPSATATSNTSNRIRLTSFPSARIRTAARSRPCRDAPPRRA